MEEDIVMIEEYARQSHTDVQFIHQLSQNGLIQIVIHQQAPCVPSRQLPLLEKYTRLHYDLDINLEGIEAISHLLQRLEIMQNEVENLRRQLKTFGSI